MGCVAIIPARGGSKRIPRKNVREFCGKPMIAWSVEAARESDCFERVIVSTEDDEVAEVARRCGAEVPFRRPAELATDHVATLPVIAHAVEWLRAERGQPDAVCCIYATAPFMLGEDLRRGCELLERSAADYVFSCTTYPFPIQRALRLDADGRLTMMQPEHAMTRSQDLPETFHDAGQFYWGRSHAFLDGRPVFGPASIPLMLPRYRVQDIDTPEDWARAEIMHSAIKELNR